MNAPRSGTADPPDAPSPSPPERPRGPFTVGDLAFGVALFVLALVPRALAAHAYAGEPVWDGHYYEFGARRIAAGLGYSDDLTIGGQSVWHPWCHYPVGYSAFLGLVYWVFGAKLSVANAANVVVGALVPVATWRLAVTCLSRGRARAAGVLTALHPGLVLYSALTMSEPLASVLTLAAFTFAAREGRGSLAPKGRPRAPLRGLAIAGLLLGLSTLVRPTALLCAPFLLLAAWPKGTGSLAARARSHGPRLAVAAAVVALTTLLPVLPWTARNCRVMDGCALVSTNAGWNLAIGAFPRATGRFETLRSADGCREVTGQVQQDRCWLAYGLGWVRREPGRWLALVPKKLGYTFDHESFQVEYLHEARPAAWPDDKRADARNLLSNFHRVLLVCAAFGAVAFAPRRRAQVALLAGLCLLGYAVSQAASPTLWPFAVAASLLPFLPMPGRPEARPGLLLAASLLLTTALAHAIFFGEDRYHVVASPALVLLACAAFRPPAPARGRAAR